MEKRGSTYFHLSLPCQRRHDAIIEWKDMAINDEMFVELTDEHH